MHVLMRSLGKCLSTGAMALVLLATFSIASARADAPGQELFETNCGVCHGTDGMSILPMAPHFAKGERLEKPDALLIASISNGLNVMPPWKGVLSEDQIGEILTYIRTLAK